MTVKKNATRPRCDHCFRPLSHCLCDVISVAPNRTRVLILQHPDEQKHPLNTGRLAVLGLTQAQLWVGEHFSSLQAFISTFESAFLLFPAQEQHLTQPLTATPEDVSSLLIVPDGTWRKARKIIAVNPVLTTLPHLSLPVGEPSQYRVRKASEAAAVSTIEAIVRTLAVLEPEHRFESVLKPFDRLIEQQIQAMGVEVYERNYGRKRQP